MTVEDTLSYLYEQGGQSAVYDWVLAHRPEWSWGWCAACECRSPIWPHDGGQLCAVCWSVIEQKRQAPTCHYLITTVDQRLFLAPNCESALHALALPCMPPMCDVAAIDEWQGDCTWLNIYHKETA